MLLALRARGIEFPKLRQWPGIALVGVLLLGVANSFMAFASRYLPSIMVSLLLNISPLIYVGLQSAFGERVPRKAWGGLAVGFAGVLILVAPKVMQGGHFQADHHTLMAICALVLGPLAWNFGAIYATHRPIKCNHMMSASAQNLAGGLGALLVALPLGEMHGLGRVDLYHWLVVLWLIVVGSWMGYAAYLYCVLHLSSPRVAITTTSTTWWHSSSAGSCWASCSADRCSSRGGAARGRVDRAGQHDGRADAATDQVRAGGRFGQPESMNIRRLN